MHAAGGQTSRRTKRCRGLGGRSGQLLQTQMWATSGRESNGLTTTSCCTRSTISPHANQQQHQDECQRRSPRGKGSTCGQAMGLVWGRRRKKSAALEEMASEGSTAMRDGEATSGRLSWRNSTTGGSCHGGGIIVKAVGKEAGRYSPACSRCWKSSFCASYVVRR